jgi:hypothetical protein
LTHDALPRRHTSFAITADYTPVVADLDSDGSDDIVWCNRAGSADLWTRWSTTRERTTIGLTIPAGLAPLVGAFSTDGADGIFWYGPGPRVDAVWYR